MESVPETGHGGQISVALLWSFPGTQMQVLVAESCFCIHEVPPSWVGGVPLSTGAGGSGPRC